MYITNDVYLQICKSNDKNNVKEQFLSELSDLCTDIQ